MGILQIKIVAVVVALALLGGWFSWYTHQERALGRSEGRAEVELKWDAERRAAAKLAADERDRQVKAQQEIAREYNKSLASAQVDAQSARDAADRLRQRLAAALARPGQAASAPAAGDAASCPTGMFADLFGQVVDLARRYAEIADQRGAAGHACERAYQVDEEGNPG